MIGWKLAQSKCRKCSPRPIKFEPMHGNCWLTAGIPHCIMWNIEHSIQFYALVKLSINCECPQYGFYPDLFFSMDQLSSSFMLAWNAAFEFILRWCLTCRGNHGHKWLLFTSCLCAIIPWHTHKNFHHSYTILLLSFDFIKKHEHFSFFNLVNLSSENKTHLEFDFSKTATRNAFLIYPINSQHQN